jgi:hypothetical protein
MANNLYKVTDNVDSMFATDIDQVVDALAGNNDVGAMTAYAQIIVPTALTASVNTTSGNLTGAYKYAVAFLTGYWKGTIGIGTLNVQGNTGGGAVSNTSSPVGQQINLSNIVAGPAGVVARVIYRTKANGSIYYFLQQINDNTTLTWTDNIADASLVTVMPVTNTTGSYFSGDGHGLTNLTINTGIGPSQFPIRDINGNIQNSGYKITAKSASTTLLLSENGIIDVTTGASTITLTLPSAVTAQVSYIIKKIDSGVGSVTINTTSSQTIDGVATKSIAYQYGYLQVVSDGANWQIIDGSINVTSTTADITIANPTSNPVLTVVTGTGPNVISKRDGNGNLSNIGLQSISISNNTTLTAAQSGIVFVTTGGGAVTATLPTAVGNAQLSYIFKKVDSGLGTVYIATTSSQLIDGLATKPIIFQYDYIQVVSDGANWDIIDGVVIATQAAGDNSTKPATTAYVDTLVNTSPLPTALTLAYGQQIVPSIPKVSPFNVLQTIGRTLVNLLGKDGNCEALPVAGTPWSASAATFTLDSTNKTNGLNGYSLTFTASANTFYKAIAFPVSIGKYYVALADIKNNNVASNNVTFQFSNAVDKTVVMNPTSFTTVWTKAIPTTSSSGFALVFSGAVGQIAYVDSMRVFEVSSADYTAIDGMTTAQIQAKYPYVDSVQHINGLYINKIGENMLPPFYEWTVNANATVLSPYSLQLVSPASVQSTTVDIPVLPSQAYTVAFGTLSGNLKLEYVDANGVATMAWDNSTPSSVVFTTNASAVKLRVTIYNTGGAAGTFTFTNPSLVIGSTALATFKTRNDNYLYVPNVKLASSVDGTVYDQLYMRNRKMYRENRFGRDYSIDGSLPWSPTVVDYTGYKRFVTTIAINSLNSGFFSLVKYDGKIMVKDGAVAASADLFTVDATPSFYATVADTDSGFGETYTPIAVEVAAYFWGWKLNNGTFGTPYNGTGTKTWTLWNATSNIGSVTVIPTTLATRFIPYSLTYQLAVSTFEEVQYEGSITLHEGSNQIEVGNGMIVREKANPQSNGTNYLIGGTALPLSQTKNRINKILAIFKNGRMDSTWSYDGTNAYGNQKAYQAVSLFDPTAYYEVTYIALDQYGLTSNVQAVSGEYNTNEKTIVDGLARTSADTETRISVAEKKAFDAMPKVGGVLSAYSEGLITSAVVTGSVSLDLLSANVFDLTLIGATTLAFANPVSSGSHSITLIIRQGGTAQAVTYPASVKWSNDAVPDLSAINKTSVLTFMTVNGGTRWYGFLGANGLVT